MSAASKSILTVENLSFSYEAKRLLENVNFRLFTGETVGIIGKNGCGKTTFLKLLGGFLYPQEGTITFSEEMCSSVPMISGFLETPKTLDYLTADENLRYYLGKKYKTKKAKQELFRWGLLSFADTNVKHFSLGMKQKLGLVISFLSEAPILLFDEPTNSLDYESVDTFFTCVKEAEDNGRSVVIVTHLVYELNKHCSRLYQFDNGTLQEEEKRKMYKQVYEITFVDSEQARKAAISLSGCEVDNVTDNRLYVNQTEQSISAIIRALSAFDVLSVQEIEQQRQKGEHEK